jgi:hypothetical protein
MAHLSLSSRGGLQPDEGFAFAGLFGKLTFPAIITILLKSIKIFD